MPLPPFSPARDDRGTARPVQRGCGWWGGVVMAMSSRKPTGGWGGLPPTTHQGYGLCPLTTRPRLGIFATLRFIYTQAGTFSPPHVPRCFIHTLYIPRVTSINLRLSFFQGGHITKVLPLFGTIESFHSRLRR